MAVKKSELYSNLWTRADALRERMDSSQSKDYVLSLLFLKFLSVKADSDARLKKMRLSEKLGKSYLRKN